MNDEKRKSTFTSVARINGKNILVIDNSEKRVAVRPICDALGVDYSSQLKRIKSDEILSSVVVLSTTTGADGKQYEMVTIPFKFVFGWLFRINSRNVKPEAKKALLEYQMQCYDALYSHFTAYADYVEKKQRLIEQQLRNVEVINMDFHDAKNRLADARRELNYLREISFDDYRKGKKQLDLFTEREMEG